jgi:RNA polymerase sigma factor (sigma-70 family)
MDDRTLVDRFLKKRSEREFQKLYLANTPRLYMTALRLTGHDQREAEELIQEMWCIAIRKLETFQWKSELKTWLTGILINLFRSRRRKMEKEELLAEDAHMDTEEELHDIPTVIDLENAISQLPPGYRQIVILHDIEGYKHREIASILDITEGTSKSQLFHARKALRVYLREYADKNKEL